MNNKLFHNRRKTIGLLTDNLSTGYTTLFWREIQHQCQENDVNLILFPMNYSKHEGDVFRKSILSFINDYTIDGLIVLANTLLVTMSCDELDQLLSTISSVPIVASGNILQNVNCSVIADQHTGLEEALEHLIHVMKKTKIAFVKGNPVHQHTIERFQVYCDMLDHYKLPYEEALVVDGDYFIESGIRAVHTLYHERNQRPDAIVACNDDMALGIISSLQELGLKTPEDVLVIGYDNIPEIQGGRSTLATVYQPIAQLAQTGFLVLLEILEGVAFPSEIKLSSYFIWRETAGKPGPDFRPTLMDQREKKQSFNFKELQEERVIQTLMVEGVHHLMNAQSIDELLVAMGNELPRVLIQSCFLCLFDKNQPFLNQPNQSGRLPSEGSFLWGYCRWSNMKRNEHLCFPIKNILPTSISLPNTRVSMVLEPLFMWEQAYGYLFYELGIESGSMYETIRRQIVSALKLNYLLQEQQDMNQSLKDTLFTLTETQKQLIESEKMAALGTLVAGVAHEINTPIGVSVSANSFLELETKKTVQRMESNRLTKSELTVFLKNTSESCRILNTNLNRAAELIKSFKNIAVDQRTEELRNFNVKSYLEQVLLSLSPTLKKTSIEVVSACDEDLNVYSYPGVFAQIITNLLMNALDHAFSPTLQGQIHIEIRRKPDHQHYTLSFCDNGCGISEEHLSHIFEPFFTTKRGMGGIGLGLHIVYNLVHHKLHGSIHCTSTVGVGTEFFIEIPISHFK